VIGADDARADVEVIALMMAVYDELGVKRTELRINTLGDPGSRPKYREALQAYLEPHRDRLSDNSRKRLETNPLRILDTKDERERQMLQDAPRLIDFIDEESRQHYDQVKSLLRELGIAFREDPFLVRGLDYYTRTAFELESPDLGAQSALSGGGRYDLLSKEIGAAIPVPAVGFAAGMERLFLALEAHGVELPARRNPDVFMIALEDEAVEWTFVEAQRLRRAGLYVGLDLKGRSMKAQMREANRQNVRFTLIAGKDELSAGSIQLKDMSSGEQIELSPQEIVDFIRSREAETAME
jgi:histidyl-tRNA synthetase